MSFQCEVNPDEPCISPSAGVEYRGIYAIFKGDEAHLGKIRDFPGISAEEKIVNAFLAKGREVFTELEHDFLLFLLIPAQKKFYLVRDRFGVQPLYFKQQGKTFRFSQKISRLREDEPPGWAGIRRYLVDYADSESIPDSLTFFKGIHTVPPGCYYYRAEDGTEQCIAYWKPQPEPIGGIGHPQLFSEFRERIFESVAFYTGKYDRVSAHLSGGLDSSVIALVYTQVSGRKIPTFYFDIADADHRDPYYARMVSAQVSLNHTHILPGSIDVYDAVRNVSLATGSPEVSILPSNIQYAIAEESAFMGCQAILTGMDGDSVIGHGWAYLNSLKEKDDWEVFIEHTLRRWMLHASWSRKGAARVRREIIEKELLALLKAKEIRRLKNLMKICRSRYGYVPLQFMVHLARRVYERLVYYHPPADKTYFLNRGLRFEKEDVYTSASLYEHSDPEIINNFKAAVNGEYPQHFEQFHAIGHAHGQQFLHPFFNRRLFELSLAIPDALRYGNGKTRWLMRQAMKDILPAELYCRQDKDEFGLYMIRSCCNLWLDNHEKFKENRALWQYIDKARFRKQMDVLLRGDLPFSVARGLSRRLVRILYLGIWLDTLK